MRESPWCPAPAEPAFSPNPSRRRAGRLRVERDPVLRGQRGPTFGQLPPPSLSRLGDLLRRCLVVPEQAASVGPPHHVWLLRPSVHGSSSARSGRPQPGVRTPERIIGEGPYGYKRRSRLGT